MPSPERHCPALALLTLQIWLCYWLHLGRPGLWVAWIARVGMAASRRWDTLGMRKVTGSASVESSTIQVQALFKGGNWNIHKWGKWDPLLLEKYERTWENESSNGSAYTRSNLFDPKNQKYQSFPISLEALSCLKVTHRGDNIGLLSATAPEALRFGQLCLKFQGSL